MGWGSLVWDPRELPIRREWFKDGPFVPVEFTRQSADGRTTLVIDPGAVPVRVLSAHMLSVDMLSASEALRVREGVPTRGWEAKIGSWERGNSARDRIPGLANWASAHDVDAVVWTALKPKFGGTERSPPIDEVVDYLRGLCGPVRDHAKKYIERAPRQVDTEYRRQIEAAWDGHTEIESKAFIGPVL